MVVPFRLFGTTYQSKLQGSISPKTACPLKMVPTGCPEKLTRNSNSTLRKFPKERRCHLHRGGSLKPRKHHECHATTNSSTSETSNFCRAVVVALNPNVQLIAQHPNLGKSVRICSHKYACSFCLNDKLFKTFL